MGFTPHFNLDMDRSPGFGPNACNLTPYSDSVLASAPDQVLNLATYIRSPDRSTKVTISHFDVPHVLVGTGFQVLFTPPGCFSPFLHSTIRYRSLGSI